MPPDPPTPDPSPLDVPRAPLIDARADFREIYDQGRHRRRSMTRVELAAGWVNDRLPLMLRGRVSVGARELGLIALVSALALCVVAAIALRSSAAAATPTRSGQVLASASAPASPLAPARTSSSDAGVVVVDVTGKVARPGVVTLPPGSRVYEALKAAGGARRGVDVTALNLARVMVDGEQIVVGATAGPVTPGGTKAPSSSTVSINHADETELESLPGVGPVMAKNIIDWREAHGGFTTVDELEEVTGIGPKTLAKLKPLVGL